MAFTPLGISIEQAEAEVREAWHQSYSPRAIAAAIRKIRHRPYPERLILFCTRLAFRGIYFPQMTARSWIVLVLRNSPTLLRLVSEGVWLRFRPRKLGEKSSPLPRVEPAGAAPRAQPVGVAPGPVRRKEPVA
jgi:hypothetical protein